LSGFLKSSVDGKGCGEYKERKKSERVGFEPFSLDGCHQIELLIVNRNSDPRKLAAVVGSTPVTLSIFINLVNYGIRISAFFDLGHLRLMIKLFYPLFLALNVRKMGMLNNRNRKMSRLRSIHLVATIFILTIIFASTTTLVSASTSGNTTTTNTTSVGGEEQEAVSSTITTSNISNAVLGSLFLTGENIEFNVNPINETYSVISYLGSRIMMPPNAPGIVINATETGNVTSNIQPNGLSIEQGQGFIVTEDGAAAEKEENATFTYVMLSRANPGDTGSGTGVAFFNTNSTGKLAFLDNMLAIAHVEFSPEGSTLKIWEWKGGTLPLETGGSGAPTTGGNQTTPTSTLEEE
jgi:hypothetical protein